jgi:hypothetical protein
MRAGHPRDILLCKSQGQAPLDKELRNRRRRTMMALPQIVFVDSLD